MEQLETTLAIQAYLDELDALDGSAPSDAVVRALMARSFDRLGVLCGCMLHQSYERLTRPPLNLRTEELLSSVVERLLKAMASLRPGSVRQFFALVNQHMRWELNDLARRLDEQTRVLTLEHDAATVPETSGSVLSPRAQRILEAIENLPDEEREVFDLVRIQGLSQTEAGVLVGASTRTVQRRLNRAIILLSEALADLRPDIEGSP